jgi:hypothetical protein
METVKQAWQPLVLSVLAGVLTWFLIQHAPRHEPHSKPCPCPPPHRHPALEAKVGGDVAPDGAEVQVDMPTELRMHNTGGRDGAGLCVFTSINHAALWQDVDVLKDFQKWMKSRPGGGYPEKVDATIKAKCKEAGVPVPLYVQVEGRDLEPIRLALKTGRMVCNTYGFSPSGRYGGRRIAHMVNTVHGAGGYYGILDNNYPEQIEWLNEQEFSRAYATDGGWSVILLDPGPPPVPHNIRR